MQHVVMLKFDKRQDESILAPIINRVYDQLRDEFKVIENYKYHINCLEIDANMDLVLFVDIAQADKLGDYIHHPSHVEFLNDMKNLGLCSKAAIDIIK